MIISICGAVSPVSMEYRGAVLPSTPLYESYDIIHISSFTLNLIESII